MWARLVVDNGELVLRMSPLQRLGAFHGDVRVPLSAVERVEVAPDPWHGVVRGVRAPGTALPRVVALGTWRHGGGKDFLALRGRRRPAVVVHLREGAFRRLVVSAGDAQAVAASISAA